MAGNRPRWKIEVRVKSQIDRDWSAWLGDMTINHSQDGSTLLSGVISDQGALFGLLSRLSSLGLQIISVSYGDTTRGGKEASMNNNS
jgi:hypothetical protein